MRQQWCWCLFMFFVFTAIDCCLRAKLLCSANIRLAARKQISIFLKCWTAPLILNWLTFQDTLKAIKLATDQGDGINKLNVLCSKFTSQKQFEFIHWGSWILYLPEILWKSGQLLSRYLGLAQLKRVSKKKKKQQTFTSPPKETAFYSVINQRA